MCAAPRAGSVRRKKSARERREQKAHQEARLVGLMLKSFAALSHRGSQPTRLCAALGIALRPNANVEESESPVPAAPVHSTSSSYDAPPTFEIKPLLFSDVRMNVAKTVEQLLPTDDPPEFVGTWEVLPEPLVQLHSWLDHNAPQGMSLVLISYRFVRETHTVLELPPSITLGEWLVQFPRFFEVHRFESGTHVAPIPLQ